MIIRTALQLSKQFTQKPSVLGRWSYLESSDALQRRIDLANIDHCGPCGFEQIETKYYKDKKYDIHTAHSDNAKKSTQK